MKKCSIGLYIIGFFLMMGLSQAKAQLSISVNIGSQPTWGPVGYDRADYYYLPDVESYYSVSNHQFIYLSNGRWTFAASLPGRYANYDLNSGYKVVVNRPRPYLNFNQDRAQYSKYKGYHGHQNIIRDSRDERYHGNPHGNPPGQDKKGDKYDNRDDKGHGNDNRDGDHQDQGNDKHGGDQGRGNDKHDNGGNKGHGHDN